MASGAPLFPTCEIVTAYQGSEGAFGSLCAARQAPAGHPLKCVACECHPQRGLGMRDGYSFLT